jgi:hypothetical protein
MSQFLRRFVASADEDDEDEEEFRLGGIDREPEVRELSILQLQSYARACIDDIEMNNQVSFDQDYRIESI